MPCSAMLSADRKKWFLAHFKIRLNSKCISFGWLTLQLVGFIVGELWFTVITVFAKVCVISNTNTSDMLTIQ